MGEARSERRPRLVSGRPAASPFRIGPLVRRLDQPRLWALAALAVAVAVMAPRLLFIRFVADDGLVGAWAMLVRAGAVPYRDFPVSLPPATVVLYGTAFKLFGPSYLVLRLITATAIVGTAVLAFAVGARTVGRGLALLASATWIGWAAIHIQFGPYHYWSTAFAVAAAWAIVRSRERPAAAVWPFLAGVCAGSAVLFMQSLVPVALAGFIALAADRDAWRRRALLYSAGGGAVALSGLAYIVAMGVPAEFFNQTVVYAAGTYAHAVDLPIPWEPFLLHDVTGPEYGGMNGLPAMFVIWPLAFVGPLAILLALLRRLAAGHPFTGGAAGETAAIFSTALFASVFLVHRPGAAQLWFAAPLAIAFDLRWCWDRIRARRWDSNLAAVPILFLLGLLLVWPGPQGWIENCGIEPGGAMRPVTFRSLTICSPKDDAAAYRQALAFSDAHVSERVAFLPMSSPLYSLTGRTPPESDGLFIMPGLLPPGRLARLQDELVSRRVEWVLYQPFDWKNEWQGLPADTALLSDQTWSFEAFLDSHYDREPAAGPLIVYRLRSS